MEDIPTVSICMITYGHEKFIEEAINGVLMQKCNFKIELILSNDCSPDKTHEVVQRIVNNDPKAFLIRYFRKKKNIGLMPNFINTLEFCKGKYIALCDGDDYWTDPLKLQKQVDFLETNPDYVIHSGNAVQLSSDPAINLKTLLKETTDTSFVLTDFLSNNNLITCTLMYRNVGFQFPKDFNKVPFGDWFISVILMNKTGLKAYRSTEVFSAYRIHDAGVMGSLNEINFCNTHILQIIMIHKYLQNKRFGVKERDTLNYYLFKKYSLILKEKKYLEALKTAWTNFKYCGFNMPFRKFASAFKYR